PLRTLYEKDYGNFPASPCSYCSRLLNPHSVKWVIKNDNFVYPLQSSFPQLQIHVTSQKLPFAMDVNPIVIIDYVMFSLKYLSVFMMYHMQSESISLPSIYIPV